MALALSAIRTRIATRVTAALGASGWRVSRYTYDQFPGDTRLIEHLDFAVGVLRSDVEPLDRRRRSVGAQVETAVAIKYTHRIRPDAAVADYDAALDAEQALVQAILGVSLADMTMRWTGAPSRSLVADGTLFLGEVTFVVRHGYALQ